MLEQKKKKKATKESSHFQSRLQTPAPATHRGRPTLLPSQFRSCWTSCFQGTLCTGKNRQQASWEDTQLVVQLGREYSPPPKQLSPAQVSIFLMVVPCLTLTFKVLAHMKDSYRICGMPTPPCRILYSLLSYSSWGCLAF